MTDDGLFQFGHSKDHRPDLPQLKLMAAVAQPTSQMVACDVVAGNSADDPLYLLPKARSLVEALDTGDGVLIFSDIYGATPCNLAAKLLVAGRVEAVAGVNLPMLVRAFTYRDKGMETMIKKAISGGCDGVLHINVDPIYAATRS